MKIVIFAGGSGTRFWPISRNNFPKQFHPLINNKSTIELMVENIVPTYGWNNIYFATTEKLVSLIKNFFPELPTGNIITEPIQRDVGPAVGLAMLKLQKLGAGDEPVTVLWGDSYAGKSESFRKVLNLAEKKLRIEPKKLVWLAQPPSFANENVGWIELGEKLGEEDELSYYKLSGFKYRPKLEVAEEWFESGNYAWNTGYFVTTPNFILEKYEIHNKEVYSVLSKIRESLDTEKEITTVQEEYPKMPAVHFDNIVLDNIDNSEAEIISADFAFNDPGTLYALKQFMEEKKSDNVCKGKVYNYDTKDSLVFNYVSSQTVTTVGLDGFIVVNTPDALLVCHKDDVKRIKEMLTEFKDTDLERLL